MYEQLAVMVDSLRQEVALLRLQVESLREDKCRQLTIGEIEKHAILERVEQFSGNRRLAAQSLQVNYSHLCQKFKQWKREESAGQAAPEPTLAVAG